MTIALNSLINKGLDAICLKLIFKRKDFITLLYYFSLNIRNSYFFIQEFFVVTFLIARRHNKFIQRT